MNVEVRKSAQGTEYWDTKAKKVRFVPAGKEPGFEVEKETKSTLKDESPKVENAAEDDAVDLNKLDADQLLVYAKDNDIEVPGNMKKEETIRKHIEESLAADE
jgi:hypothetical protein